MLPNKKLKLLFLVTEDYYFWSHRLPIAKAAQKEGFDVYVATHVNKHGKQIQQEGFVLLPTVFSRNNQNLFKQLKALLGLVAIFWRVRPDIVFNVPLKSAVFGTIAAWLTRMPVTINLLPGLGFLFFEHTKQYSLPNRIAKWMGWFLFQRSGVTVVVQNSDDLAEIKKMAPRARVELIRGSGVDITRYFPRPEPSGPIKVTLVARMSWHKGIAEFIEAARILKAQGESMILQIVGGLDFDNIAPISENQLLDWQSQGLISWLGHQDNIADIWANSHMAVLPTYREGLPKSLLEAAACGRAMIASDAPGCREIVLHGHNGLLVPVKDALSLAKAIQKLAHDPILRSQMGENGRKLVCREFSNGKVVEQTVALYEKVSDCLL